jgi:indole-3-glycerol phosphate synthase
MHSTIRPTGVLEAGGVLDRIVAAKAERVARSKYDRPLADLMAEAGALSRRASFGAALSETSGTRIIAEIKHRSPSKGIIRSHFDPEALAAGYEVAGATALSVLTEEDFFGGSLDHMRVARARVGLPLLRKDFLFDSYQLYEALGAGADAILLIVAVLEDELLADLISLASELKLDALVEVHSAEEMDRAVRAGARIIGVNNRDLRTFSVDLGTSERLALLAPSGALLVSESGIKNRSDVERLTSAGYHAFLIGEQLMQAPDPGEALKSLLAAPENQ